MPDSMRITNIVPALQWVCQYNKASFGSDLLASIIVTIMLVPQGLAYSMLAGLPPERGLYASIMPLLGYAFFGSNMVLAVRPVAVISLMTFTALSKIAQRIRAVYRRSGCACHVIWSNTGLSWDISDRVSCEPTKSFSYFWLHFGAGDFNCHKPGAKYTRRQFSG